MEIFKPFPSLRVIGFRHAEFQPTSFWVIFANDFAKRTQTSVGARLREASESWKSVTLMHKEVLIKKLLYYNLTILYFI